MIVIDTNILAYRMLEDAEQGHRERAARVMDRDRVLLPVLWRHEFLNILANYAKAGRLSLSAAAKCWYQAVATVQEAEADVDLLRALELSQELGISAYDAQFLALAEAANALLITEDKKLRKAAGRRTASMEEYLAA